MVTRYANQADFANWAVKARAMTDAALEWSIRDALEASEALAGHDPAGSSRYRDEALTYAQERQSRKATATMMSPALAWGLA